MREPIKVLKPVSLKIKSGTEHTEIGGSVDVVGSCVVLIDKNSDLVLAYCLQPGETVLKVKEGVYAIEY